MAGDKKNPKGDGSIPSIRFVTLYISFRLTLAVMLGFCYA
ncbi:hypothetical protein GCM10027167_90430 [Nocardia heshunensis]